MPIYEYSCRKCGSVIERIQKFSDPPLKKHEGCGGALTKLISQSAFQLKGSGWYVTDYAGKGADAAKDKEQAGAGKEAGKEKEKTGGANGDAPSESKDKSEASPSGKTGKKTAKKSD